ncbi:MAG: SGNH/GDSL hydrolase family protein [Candidatus Excrementavichristensenella sp.]
MRKGILCFGDSNTYGYDPAGGRYDEETRWPMVMQRILGEGYRVVEEGLGGRTFSQDDPTEGGFKSGISYLPPCLKSHNPLELVIVMLGTNDIKQRFGLNAQTIAHNLNEVVRIVRSYGMSAEGTAPGILVVSPPHIGEWVTEAVFSGAFVPHAHAISLELAGQLQRYSKLLKCHFVDAAAHVQSCPADGVHLTAQAQIHLGRVLAEVVRELVPQ